MILIWNMGLGGIQKRVRDIVIDIDHNYPGWEVYLLVKFKKPSYFITKILAQSNIHIRYYSQSHKKSNALPSFFWVIRQFLTIKPSVCLTFLDHLSVTLVLMKKVFFWIPFKVVLNEGVLTSTYLQLNRHWIWQNLVKLTYKHANLIIVPTRTIAKDLHRNFDVPTKKITVVSNWTLFPPVSPKPNPPYHILFVGRFEKEKNPQLFLEVCKELLKDFPILKAALVGEGRLEDSLRSYCANNNLNKHITFLPFQENTNRLFQDALLLIMTTLNEGMPNVVLEAGMCQVPVVSTQFLGVEEVIKSGETGFIVKNKSQMIEKISLLLRKKSLRQKMGIQAQKYISTHFSRPQQRLFIKHLLQE